MSKLLIKNCILTINGGSSSIKYALYEMQGQLKRLFSGELENIGSKNANLRFIYPHNQQTRHVDMQIKNHEAAAHWLIDCLEKENKLMAVKAIGHRIVHGMKHTEPELVTPQLIKELKEISPYDPEHLPEEIKLIEVFGKRYPALAQIACFDTSFHTSMPTIAKLLPLPRRYYEMGIQRYGFHGLSYAYLMEQLSMEERDEKSLGRVILAHLGNGASLAAVKDGKSIDTSMGFTPTAGLPMSTRTGDLDPGVALYLMKEEKLSPKQFNHLVNHESGLLGVSGTSADMRELLKDQKTNSLAADAVNLFCYQTKKWIGSFAAVLGGIDTLVFSGGIGENSPEIRERVCSGLQFLGIELDKTKNATSDVVISSDMSKVCVRVIKTNEELMIARLTCKVMNYTIKD